jgi:2,4-dienoyl-CoA reductase-like NADH-dependent reductase (Old Yellow Enzyme family)
MTAATKPTNGANGSAPHPELFEPITIGDVEIKNRIAMAPMNTLFSMNNLGYANEQIMAYYAARAKGGAGLIISECVLGTRMASRFPYTSNLHLFNGTHVPGLEEIVETIHAFGARTFIQLSIGFGRQGHSHDHEPPPAPSAIPYETDPNMLPTKMRKMLEKNAHLLNPKVPTMAVAHMPREMTREEIKSEIEEFGHSCVLAVMAGFDGIELHAPHGYLEHQFLSPRTNRRTDEYGGSLQNRMRFVIEVYDKVREMIGNSVAVGIRLSGDEHMPDGIHHDELKEVVRTLGKRGIDYVHLSSGSYEATKYFFPEKDGTMLDEAAGFKSVLPAGVPVMTPSIHDPAMAARAISEGKTDLISLGRQLLIDPEWANKVRAGDKFRRCTRCCECLMRTALGMPVRCLHNRDLGREKYIPEYWRPTREKGRPVMPQFAPLP